MNLVIEHTLAPGRVGQLLELYAAADWASHRTREDVDRMLSETDLVFALVDRSQDRLVGFTRVLTDFVYRAMVFDVIVAPGERERGLGRRLLDAVVHAPQLVRVETLELTCQPELIAFYARWGFTDSNGGSTLMRLTR
jgi:predicted GNAT family N-acyltransferase